MLKIPYLIEGITNIFKPAIVEKSIETKEEHDKTIIINRDLCIDCGKCIEVCPTNAISREIKFKEEDTIDIRIDNEYCINCGLCKDFCIIGAIEHSY